jgi:chitinase
MWVTAYYTTWGVCELPPGDIDFSGVTHLIHQSIDPDAGRPGRYWRFPDVSQPDDTLYFEQGVGVGCGASPVQANLINFAHQNGVKVLLGLGGVFDGQFEIITADSNKVKQYAHSVLSYARQRGYDGVDLDWEFVWSGSRQGFILLLRTLRDSLNAWTPRGLLTIALPGWYNSGYGYDIPAMNTYCDQINMMYYDLAGSWDSYTGFNAPIYPPAYPQYEGAAIDPLLTDYLARGLDRTKIALGVPFYSVFWYNNTAPGQVRNGGVFQGSYRNVLARLTPSTYHWDNTAKVPWLGVTGDNIFISYDDSLSLTEKVNYARSRNLGGIMIFELWRGIVPSNPVGQRQPLMTAVKIAVMGSGTPVVPGDRVPKDYRLSQNYPNPFNPNTTIAFSLPRAGRVNLTVLNLLGQEVATLVDGERQPGEHTVAFNGSQFPSGVYFYRLTVIPLASGDSVPQRQSGETGSFAETKKLVLLK